MTRTTTIWTFAITSVALFMATLDNLVVTTSLPVIRTDLGASIEDLEWTVNAYTLSFAVFLLMGAALGDRFGRRRMFVIGLGIFTAASVAAALAPSVEALIAARAVQGLGGAIVTPLTLTILSAAVSPEKRGVALGAWGGIGGLAVAQRPARRRRRRRGHLLAVDLLAERADRARPDPARVLPPEGDLRPAPRGSTCPASCWRAPACSGSCGASSAGTRSAGRAPRSSASLAIGAAAHGGVRALGAPRAGADAADALLPQPRLLGGERRPRSSCSSGCSARSSCWRSSCRPCRATARFDAGLRILPWTAMPIFIAPDRRARSPTASAAGR